MNTQSMNDVNLARRDNLNNLLKLLESGRFERWYNEGGRLDEYVTGDLAYKIKDDVVARNVVLDDLSLMLEQFGVKY